VLRAGHRLVGGCVEGSLDGCHSGGHCCRVFREDARDLVPSGVFLGEGETREGLDLQELVARAINGQSSAELVESLAEVELVARRVVALAVPLCGENALLARSKLVAPGLQV
jgi:hypothetical protein